MIKGILNMLGLALFGLVILFLLGSGLIVPVVLLAVVGAFGMYVLKSFS